MPAVQSNKETVQPREGCWSRTKLQQGRRSAHHADVVEVDDQEGGAQLLVLQQPRHFDEQVHGLVPHPPNVLVQLPVLQHTGCRQQLFSPAVVLLMSTACCDGRHSWSLYE